ncbi:MAG: T9SS type A sorting domain-containing protein [Bacteroidota bacterium]
MRNPTYAYARLRRQYRYLGKQLQALTRSGSRPSQKLLSRFRSLTKRLAPKLGRTGLYRALGSAAGVLGLALTAQAQLLVLDDPVFEPFELDSSGIASAFVPSLVDIDGDGDLDLFHRRYGGDDSYIAELSFYENIGDEEEALFAAPVNNPFGFTSPNAEPYTNANFADFDGDGDIDIMAQLIELGDYFDDSEFVAYYENTGTVSSPQFAPGVESPFGLPFAAEDSTTFILLSGDLDDDGDIDLLSYEVSYGGPYMEGRELRFFENVPSSGDPNFSSPVSNPFGLDDLAQFDDGEYNVPTKLVDLDNDGDLDILGTANVYDYISEDYESQLFYIENQGSAAEPQFGNIVYFDPGVEGDFNTFIIPDAGDLDNDGDVDILGVGYGVGFVYLENLNSTSVREQVIDLDIQVFPNPTTNFIRLRTSEDIDTYILVDGQGRELLRAAGQTQEIPLAQLPAGQYWLKAITPEQTFAVFPLIKE